MRVKTIFIYKAAFYLLACEHRRISGRRISAAEK